MMHSMRIEQCPNCHKMIDASRIEIHLHMCSTAKLRQSRIFSSRLSQQNGNATNAWGGNFQTGQQIQPSYGQNPNNMYTNNSSMGPQFILNNGQGFQNVSQMNPIVEVNQKMGECLFCNEEMPQYSLELHMNLCQNRLVTCDRCKCLFPMGAMPQHLGQCNGPNQQQPQFPVNNQMIERNEQEPEPEQQLSQLQQGSKVIMDSIMRGINTFSSKFIDKRNKILKFIQDNKGPAIEAFNKFKNDLRNRLQDAIAALAADPNADGLPRDQIQKIQTANYKAKHITGEQEDKCAICICEFEDEQPIKVLNCRHIFHPECIDKWMHVNSLCPLCKRDQNIFAQVQQ